MLPAAGIWLHAGQTPGDAQAGQQFDKHVAPLLARACLECHAGTKPRGGLDLSTHKTARLGGDNGAVIVPGNAAASVLWQLVDAGKMPPKKTLAATEKKLIKQWIEEGAVWGTDSIDPFRFTTNTRAGYDWWSLQPVAVPPLPAVQNKMWPRNAVDHFVLARLEASRLAPSAEASRHVLIRRLYFDLIGLPPSPDEVSAFVHDLSPVAYETLVDRLLASPHYGERWARHWLDVVRFGESNGFEHDELRPNAWPYRDWVIRALNQDMPFDEFARWQVAGDVLRPDDPWATVATGMLVAGGYDSVGQQQQSQAMKAVVRQDELEDMIGTVGQAFLGLTVHCARCHDHKFDPVHQREYYQLAAALAGVHPGQRPADLASADSLAERKASQAELAELQRQLRKLEEPFRQVILAERRKSPGPGTVVPAPLARWDFGRGLRDTLGSLHASTVGDAKLSTDGLLLTGKSGYAATAPLPRAIKGRTLAGLVQLADLAQKGGAVISLQNLDGGMFDAIVFGERQSGHWMAGSEGYTRTQSFQGESERTADGAPVHFAIVYAEDGTITAYRNGRPYGKPYKSDGPKSFAAGKAHVVFGLRHAPAQPGRMLAGTLVQAELFDRPLSAPEVAAVAGSANDYVSEKELLGRLDEATQDRRARVRTRIESLQAALQATAADQFTYAVAPREPALTHMLMRGNPAQKGEVMKAGGVAAPAGSTASFGLSADAPDAERRKKLAEWITHPQNPLFTRVIVNRLWQHHFGAGLVDTPNDFGFNGGRPSHPLLLDWLAGALQRHKYSLKSMHRLIVTSATYRQASAFNAPAHKLDAANRLLWRKSPMRLEAEVVRDSILSVSGQLNGAMAGSGFKDFKVSIRGATYTYEPMDAVGSEFQRRSIYRTWPRSGRNALLDAFDCPDPSTATHKRAVTTTPLQALTLLNNAFVLRMADALAQRLQAEAGNDVRDQIIRAYRLAYGRTPSEAEMTEVRPMVERHGLFVLCRALFSSNEFVYVD
jgi:hypothetical protein